MPRSRSLAALLCGLGLAGLLQAAPVVPAQHHVTGTTDAGHSLVPARRWRTEPALRTGMGRIRAAMLVLSGDTGARLSDAAVREQAARIADATAYLFAHCDLAPDADAALHGMLVPLLAATRRLKEHPGQRSAVSALRRAVRDYPRYFDDPGWTGGELHDVP
jgi:hypothetical protein